MFQDIGLIIARHAERVKVITMDHVTATLVLCILLSSGLVAIYLLRRSRAEREDNDFQHAYRLATEMAHEGFYVVHPLRSAQGEVIDWNFTDCNDRGAAYFGLRKHELIGKHLSHLYSAASLNRVLAICARAMDDGYHEAQFEAVANSPLTIKWVHLQAISSKPGLAFSLRDVSSKQEHALEMARLAYEDPTTTLPNRQWLADFLPRALSQAKERLALLFIDLDDFKYVNDSLGHPVGDMLLRATAMRLKSVIGPGDKVVRLGGDEFAIVLTDINNTAQARRMAEMVNEVLCFPLELVKGKKSITTSIGVSLYPEDGDDLDSLLISAEIAMYAAKSSGKARFRFYDPTLYETLAGRLIMEQELAEAIERDEFVLVFEPRVRVSTGCLCGMEALVRWIHPTRGSVPPLEFIPLAESTGMILKLGDLLIDKVFRHIRHWQDSSLPTLPVSINISARQFNNGNLSRVFIDAFDRYQINPALIQIELTESTTLGDEASIIKELAAIRSLGIKLLIDDFGTGYSSLSQLQRLKMDTLKIDRSFLHELDRTREGEIFVKAIISMAHALGMDVIAEGVETEQQLRILRSLSCDEIQGHYFSKPVSSEVMSQFLARSHHPMTRQPPTAVLTAVS
jgi:diguanylate cyclase (GGDEF)-like protein